MAFPTGWSSQKIKIDVTALSLSGDVTNYPYLLDESAFSSTVFSNSQGKEINTNYLLSDANLQGYWRLESDGTDSGPNSYDLSGGNTPTHATGKFGNGVDLELDSTQYYKRTDASGIDNLQITGDLCISAWIKPESIGASRTIVMAQAAGEDEAQNTLYSFYINSDGYLAMDHEYGSGSNESMTSTLLVTTGVWQHVTVVRDVSTNTCRFYLNTSSEDETYTNDPTGGTSANFIIGASDGEGSLYDGMIDDVAIFDRTLSDEEVRAIYTGGADLRFSTDSAGATQIPHGVVNWDIEDDEAEVWVKIPTVDADASFDIYAWYNNASAVPLAADSTYGGHAAFGDADLVVLFDDNVRDHTGDNTTTAYGMPYTFVDEGSRRALQFDGSDDTILYGTSLGVNSTDFSFMVMYKKRDTTTAAWGNLISAGVAGTDTRLNIRGASTTTGLFSFYNDDLNFSIPNDTSQHLLWGSYIASTNARRIAVDDASTYDDSDTSSGDLDTEGDPFYIGSVVGAAPLALTNIDMVFFWKSTQKSDDFFKLSYAVQISPGTYVSPIIETELSDSLSLTDTMYRLSDINRYNTESLTMTDTVARVVTFDRDTTDTFTVSDTLNSQSLRIVNRALYDSMTMDDTLTRVTTFGRFTVSSMVLTDEIARELDSVRSVDSTMTFTDSIGRAKTTFIIVSDSMTMDDTLSTFMKLSSLIVPQGISVKDVRPRIYIVEDIKPKLYSIE